MSRATHPFRGGPEHAPDREVHSRPARQEWAGSADSATVPASRISLVGESHGRRYVFAILQPVAVEEKRAASGSARATGPMPRASPLGIGGPDIGKDGSMADVAIGPGRRQARPCRSCHRSWEKRTARAGLIGSVRRRERHCGEKRHARRGSGLAWQIAPSSVMIGLLYCRAIGKKDHRRLRCTSGSVRSRWGLCASSSSSRAASEKVQ